MYRGVGWHRKGNHFEPYLSYRSLRDTMCTARPHCVIYDCNGPRGIGALPHASDPNAPLHDVI
eukprot:5809924-Alexandrium_andersonii.AAC.1